MGKISYALLFSFLFVLTLFASTPELKEKLAGLDGVTQIELLESNRYTEKYVVRITQLLDPHNPAAGTFSQRVIIGHHGFDRPTVIVTEGYGAAYALRERYQDEISGLLNANVIVVEHRYFLESTPEPLNWDYLTAENSAYDLHRVTTTFKTLYPGKWISTGISKGGQTTMLYRAYFPDDVDISVPYVGPLNRDVEDGRHEEFLRQVGTSAVREQVEKFQIEVLKRRTSLQPIFEAYCKEKELSFRLPIHEIYDYAVLEYPFAFWQWGVSANEIPSLTADDQTVFDHFIKIGGPAYFSENQSISSFFVQAARDLGYYGYDTEPFKEYLSISTSKGYLNKIMVPASAGEITFNPALYEKVYNYLSANDPKMIFIYGEYDPWSASGAPQFAGKKNQQKYILPQASHSARISNMPEDMASKVIDQLNAWLNE
ncbi:S28 family serine protease [Parabacteroides sp. PF5-9]|uniref:S28 family serine protease n=1 Tax=Parabacteroides sp. PF5-9 TaxID=1742404 RepID=UPI002473E688|nr:S28 family serine protease [Parabacteroides sp. PF5-9]MDH6356653.1 hypothetical protein [Parabacteroides sp. PF5-9]